MRQHRINGLRKIMAGNHLDGFLVSNFYNILYLSGFKTLVDNEREAWLLVTKTNQYLFTDSRYATGKEKDFRLLEPGKGLIKHLEEITGSEKIKTIGIEANDLKVIEFEGIKKYLPAINLPETERLVIGQRADKENDEIEKIEKACKISDQCLTDIVRLIKVGMTEKEIAFRMEFWLKEKGYELAFYPIVAVDENSAVAHYDTQMAGQKKIKDGSIVLIDFGAKYQDYTSDVTRMVLVGKPDDQILTTYNRLLAAQEKTIEKLSFSQSLPYAEIDRYCRERLTANMLPNYRHATGHGVGLEVHEFPKISPVSTELVLPNHVVAIEPGIYFQDKWGMRIEDTVLVKENGAEVLTKFSKKPIIK
ncbi:Xaa-Pro peptidase family protein [Patescibacteria group bacterium]|nr:Xaa-Pro peptidase family protein [Patescibacteria group bacterium]